MMIRVVEARYLEGHRVWLRFNDAREGVLDLSDELWGEVFQPLRDPAFFAQFRIEEAHTLTWPNGADFAPEFLHSQLG